MKDVRMIKKLDQMKQHEQFFILSKCSNLQSPLVYTIGILNLDDDPSFNKLVPCIIVSFEVFVYHLELKSSSFKLINSKSRSKPHYFSVV